MAVVLTSPTTDLGMAYIPIGDEPTPSAPLYVELQTTPGGDLLQLSGLARLAQDVVHLLYSAVGSDPFNPEWGDTLIADIGQPQAANTTSYLQQLERAESDFLARQARDASLGFLSLDEQAAYFADPTMTISGATLTVALTVVAKSGTSTSVSTVLSI